MTPPDDTILPLLLAAIRDDDVILGKKPRAGKESLPAMLLRTGGVELLESYLELLDQLISRMETPDLTADVGPGRAAPAVRRGSARHFSDPRRGFTCLGPRGQWLSGHWRV